jgi:ABC-type transporter Mla maintaining outer membrane lipid asymmetry ATPase subunit MlaF
VAILAEHHIIIAAPLSDVMRFEHPFVQNFFDAQSGAGARPQLRAEGA